MRLHRWAYAHLHFLATSFSRVAFGVLALFLITALGTGGYVVIEGWSLLDAFYMTVITITTVGYSETRPLDDVGRIYTIGLILSGVGTAFYILTALVSTIIEGDLQQVFGERRVRTRISELSGHHIVCGYGRVGQEVVLELTLRHANFIVVDSDLAPLERAQKEGYLTLHGDATEEATLLEAGLERCNSLIAAADSDSGNTYITLTAKSLRPDVFVVARVGSAANEGKLRQAGADRVVSPYQMGGRRIALAALQPALPDIFDVVAAAKDRPGILRDFAVDQRSDAAGKSLEELLARTPNVIVLALRNDRGTFILGPDLSTRLALGDRLMVFGGEEDMQRIQRGFKLADPSSGQ